MTPCCFAHSAQTRPGDVGPLGYPIEYLTGPERGFRPRSPPDPDRVLHFKPGLLASRLDRVDRLAREPLAAQVVVQLQIQRDRVHSRALEPVALERLEDELQIVARKWMVLTVDRDPHRASAPQRS